MDRLIYHISGKNSAGVKKDIFKAGFDANDNPSVVIGQQEVALEGLMTEPASGTAGQVLTKTQTGYDWENPSSLVEANPEITGSETSLESIKINDTKYKVGGGNVDDVKVDGVSVVANKVANITTDTAITSAKLTSGIGWQEEENIITWDGSVTGKEQGTVSAGSEPSPIYKISSLHPASTQLIGGRFICPEIEADIEITSELIASVNGAYTIASGELAFIAHSAGTYTIPISSSDNLTYVVPSAGCWVYNFSGGATITWKISWGSSIIHKINSIYISSGSTTSGKVLKADGNGGITWGEGNVSGIAAGYGTDALVFNNIEDSKTAYGTNSNAFGNSTVKVSDKITDFTNDTTIISTWSDLGDNKFALAKGENAKVEGSNCLALGKNSHAEGNGTLAQGNSAHAEGTGSQATGNYTHAGGLESVASGLYSFTHGKENLSSGDTSITLGRGLIASGDSQVIVGRSNIEIADTAGQDGANAQFIVANGGTDARANAFVVYKDGHSKISVKGNLDTPLVLDTKHNNSYIEFQSNGSNLGYIGFLNDKSPVVYTDGVGDQKIVLANKTTGDVTLSGKLTVGSAPTNDMDAATKQYVDEHSSSGTFVINGTYNGTDYIFDKTYEEVTEAYATYGSDMIIRLYGLAPSDIFVPLIEGPSSSMNQYGFYITLGGPNVQTGFFNITLGQESGWIVEIGESSFIKDVKINGASVADIERNVDIPLVSESANGIMTSADKSKLDGIAAGAEVNTITDVKVNGVSVVTDKVANIQTPFIIHATTSDPTQSTGWTVDVDYDTLNNFLSTYGTNITMVLDIYDDLYILQLTSKVLGAFEFVAMTLDFNEGTTSIIPYAKATIDGSSKTWNIEFYGA